MQLLEQLDKHTSPGYWSLSQTGLSPRDQLPGNCTPLLVTAPRLELGELVTISELLNQFRLQHCLSQPWLAGGWSLLPLELNALILIFQST
ncbi:hypothetical protein [Dongshaea marina]|uniref:hypothetical protein n=1 Tax=Dongshaea marina TaxID=2047966 RepID=UPI000D3EA8A6|nr:hypothetical protein [Dongshaea marina]